MSQATLSAFRLESFVAHVRAQMVTRGGVDSFGLQRPMSMREAARRSGVNSATFCRLLQGKTPDVETFMRVCRWLEMDANQFIAKRVRK